MVKTQNRFHNLTNKKFSRLLVLERDWEKTTAQNSWKVYWICKCDCGKITSVRAESLKGGKIRSCGCLQKEKARENGKKNSLPKGEYAKRCIYHNYKKRAEQKKINFNISREEFDLIISQNCYYCNSEPSNHFNRKNKPNSSLKYNGIDRKNSEIGYEKDNIVPCCVVCNYMKSDLKYENFIAKIIDIKNHLNL